MTLFGWMALVNLVLLLLSFLIVPAIVTIPVMVLVTLPLCVFSPFISVFALGCLATPLGWRSGCCSCNSCTWLLFKYFFYDVIERAKPNDGHFFIKKLQELFPDKFLCVITQNVDALEEKGGFSGPIHQLHGNYYNFFCSHCNEKFPNLFKGGLLPLGGQKCPKCGKTSLRTGCLLFADEKNDFDFPFTPAREAVRAQGNNDLFVIVGTSATVSPANHMPGMTRGNVVEVNVVDESCFRSDFTKKPKKFLYVQSPQDVFFRTMFDRLLARKKEREQKEGIKEGASLPSPLKGENQAGSSISLASEVSSPPPDDGVRALEMPADLVIPREEEE